MGTGELVLPEQVEPLGPNNGLDLSFGQVVLDERFQIAYRLGEVGSRNSGIRLNEHGLVVFDEDRTIQPEGSKVYAALDSESGEQVAIKIFDEPDLETIERVNSELATSILTKGGNHLAPWTDIGVGDIDDVRRRYIVSPIANGGSLIDVMRRQGTLDIKSALFVGVSIAKALDEYHGRGILHRDVKPQNILYDSHLDKYMLTDPGLAERMYETPTDEVLRNIGSASLWRRIKYGGDPEDRFLGTLGYAPLERLNHPEEREPNPAEDSYALGITVIVAVTGELPYEFDRYSAPSCAAKLKEEGPVSEGVLVARGFSVKAAKLLSACTDKPESRPIDELAHELAELRIEQLA